MIPIISSTASGAIPYPAAAAIFQMDAGRFLDALPQQELFDLIVTSPPYNIGKAYEKEVPLGEYVLWQKEIITKLCPLLKETGSICWQTGSYVKKGMIRPLDIELAPIFYDMGLKLRNRIIWHYGHGLHCRRRFSGRYETVLWFTKGDNYIFDLDAVRIPAKYPGKRSFRGKNRGQPSGNPLGKNPEDVWDIPNVTGSHVEKTAHPCQFPVGLAERLVLALTNEGGLGFDPFAGAASSGVAALLHGRRFWGCEIREDYAGIGRDRLEKTLTGEIRFRPHDKPLYDGSASAQAQFPMEWRKADAGTAAAIK